jgi:hypothetical protein
VLTLVAVEILVCAVSVLPATSASVWLWDLARGDRRWQALVVAVAAVPAYGLFALCLMILSPVALRCTSWRTPPEMAMRIADMEWPLLNWSRSMAAIHVVRVLAGSLFRGSPLWTMHLRLSGARVGRGVYVNSLSVSDYNLLDFADGVVIGADVHLSGHTVEHGVVKTAGVRLHEHVTVGVGTVVEIGVEIGPYAQIGALSFLPKHTRLEGRRTYAGIPVKELTR